MPQRRTIIFVIVLMLGLYAIGLYWGSPRLAWTAVRNLYDFNLIQARAPVWIDESLSKMSVAQREFLRASLPEKVVVRQPLLQVNVVWDYVVAARVTSSSNIGPEFNDAIYVNIFGFWVQMYSFGHSIS